MRNLSNNNTRNTTLTFNMKSALTDFDAACDVRHTADNMLQMARCYLDLAVELIGADRTGVGGYGLEEVPSEWIEEEFGPWKPADTPERNLEKGGALVAAALDRLQHPD